MHFDHIVGLPDVWLTAKLWQKESLNVYGPKGLKKFCSDMIELYKIDARYRNKGNLSLKCNEDLHNVELKEDLIVKIKNDHPEILESINSSGKLEDEIKSKLIEVIDAQKKGNK